MIDTDIYYLASVLLLSTGKQLFAVLAIVMVFDVVTTARQRSNKAKTTKKVAVNNSDDDDL